MARWRTYLSRFCWTTKAILLTGMLVGIGAGAVIGFCTFILIPIAKATGLTVPVGGANGPPLGLAIFMGLVGIVFVGVILAAMYELGENVFGSQCQRQVKACFKDPNGELHG